MGKLRRKCEDNIKMDFEEVGWDMYRIDLAQNRVRSHDIVNGLMNLQVPSNGGISCKAGNLLAP